MNTMSPSREWHMDLRAPDLHALGSLMRVCSMAVTPLAQAPMHAVLASDEMDDAVLCSSRCEFPVRTRFRLPGDHNLIAFMHEAGEGSWVGGEPLASGMLLLGMPGIPCEMRLGAGTCWSIVLLKGHDLRIELSRLGYYAQSVSRRIQRIVPGEDAESAERMRSLFECIRLRYLEQRRDINIKGLLDRLRENLMPDLVSLFPALPDNARTRHSHYLVLRRVENFIAANLRRELRVHDLCEAGSTSERNLRYIFSDFVGISPNHYLATLRLCEARRLLSEATPGQHTVRAIAMECGLWDLSRFAENYRQMFGELPSDTLNEPRRTPRERHAPYLSPGVQYT